MLKPLTKEEQDWVELTLQSMSLSEKIGQTMQDHAGRLPFKEMDEEKIGAYLEKYPVGSFFVGGEIIQKAAGRAGDYLGWVERFQKASKYPLLFSGDLEFGAGSAVKSLTAFPPLLALGATDDEEIAYAYGKYTAMEGRAAGYTWALAPGTDMLLNWMNPVITTRCLGDDARRVARLSGAVMRGMQDYGIAACAKHFPGDGVDFRDQHLITTINDLSEEEWHSTYGRVSQHIIDQGVMSYMTGHIALPWAEGGSPGSGGLGGLARSSGAKGLSGSAGASGASGAKPVPATVSRKITTGLLRERMGFQGVILSDALDMGGFLAWGNYETRILDCFNCGTDVLLWPGTRYFEVMERALGEGVVTMKRLDESVRRVLELKARLGVQHVDDEGRDGLAVALENDKLPHDLDTEARKLSRTIAQRCITLVRNREHILPLNPQTTRRVLVIKLNKVTEGRQYDRMDIFIDLLKARGLQVDILDEFEPLNTLQTWEQSGVRWDAAFAPYFLPLHGMMNTARPVGEAAKAIWAMQHSETISPIGISFATPYLLQDMPFLDTLVNAYSLHEDTVEYTVKALFGEVSFQGISPVSCGMPDIRQNAADMLTRLFNYMTENHHRGSWGMDIHEWDWVPGVGLISLMEYGTVAGQDAAIDYVLKWMSRNKGKATGVTAINSMAPFTVFPELYRRTQDQWFLNKASEVADWMLESAPRTREGAFEHTVTESAEFPEQVWADTVYMAVLFLARLAGLTGERRIAEAALQQTIIHLALLQEPGTGLLFHGWNCREGHHMSSVRWARANAWVTLAIPDIITEIKGLVDVPEELYSRYAALASGLRSCQSEGGLWHTVLDRSEFYEETSASAGIACGFIKGVKSGLLDDSFLAPARRTAEGIGRLVSDEGEVKGVSGGTPVMESAEAYNDIPVYPTLYGQGLTMQLLAHVLAI